jgi:hypothetical protein
MRVRKEGGQSRAIHDAHHARLFENDEPGSRAIPLLAMADGGYIVASSLLVGTRVNLIRDADDVARLEIVGVESIR